MAPSPFTRSLGPLSGLLCLSAACTLNFDLPEATDAAPIVIDAAPEPDAEPGFTACSENYDPVSPNTLGSGSFEIDREGWSNSADFTLDATVSLLGQSSLSVTQGAATVISTIDFPVGGGELYTVSAWVKTNNIANSGCRLRVRWRDALDATVGTLNGAYVKGTNDWTLVQSTGKSSSTAAVGRVELSCTNGAGTAWFDNIWFLEGNGPICGNLNCELDERCLADCGFGPGQRGLVIEGFNRAPMTEAWKTDIDGTWAISGSAAEQSATETGYALVLENLGVNDYRVGAEMTRSAGTGSMGLSLRGSDAAPGYQCLWEPEAGTLSIEGDDSLSSVTLTDVVSAPNYSPDATFAMQAEAIGEEIQCCVHGVAGAALSVTDATFSAGKPGLVTGQVSATFDSFMVATP